MNPSLESDFTRLSDAQAAIASSFAILPLYWIKKNGRCSCGDSKCDSPGKHPLKNLAPNGYKNATKDSKVVGKWWAAFPEANIGIVCGEISSIIVLDVDPRNGGMKSLKELQRVHGQLVETYRVLTPGTKKHGSGRHYYFAYSKELLAQLKSSTDKLPGLDVQADKRYVLAPGSNHVNGEYQIVGSPIAACESKIFIHPPLAMPVAAAAPVVADTSDLIIEKGQRNDVLAKVAGGWRRTGMEQDVLAAALLTYNQTHCRPPLEDREVRTIATSMARYEPAPEAVGLSDDDLALMFSKEHADNLRYVAKEKKWMEWGGTVWAEDDILDVWDLARRLCRDISQDLDPRIVKQLKAAKVWPAIEKAARSDKRHAVTPDIWNCSSQLFNTVKVTAELKEKILVRPHQREDYITKIAPVIINPAAKCERWLTFLDEITTPPNGAPDKELQGYLQRMAGYFLTGEIKEQKLFFLYGKGGNGKGVFMSTLEAVMGGGDHGYCKTASVETFLESNFDRHPAEIAFLRSARLVLVPDMPEGRRWNMERIKSFTGGDTQTTRFMRGNFWSFTPEFKLLIGGNNKPSLRNVNEAIKRRFVLIPFRAAITKPDKDLLTKLKGELEGILMWMLNGCEQWQVHGLRPPDIITRATEEYLVEQDPLSQWLELRTIRKWDAQAEAGVLWSSWCDWCRANEEEPHNQKWFSATLENSGYRPHRISANRRGWRGLRLRETGDPLPGQGSLLEGPEKL